MGIVLLEGTEIKEAFNEASEELLMEKKVFLNES